MMFREFRFAVFIDEFQRGEIDASNAKGWKDTVPESRITMIAFCMETETEEIARRSLQRQPWVEVERRAVDMPAARKLLLHDIGGDPIFSRNLLRRYAETGMFPP